tara:strand:+ start:1809 stop:2759 length:951 start_codon:yes stop_codon:yes gene_type:complete
MSNTIKPIIISLIFTSLISCGNPSAKKSSIGEKTLTGYYERAGTIQYVNNVAIDTISTVEGFRATKLFLDGFHIWIDNSKPQNQNAPWGYSAGIFGKYKIENDTLHEIAEHGFGGRAGWTDFVIDEPVSWFLKDTINNTITYKAKVNISEDKFSQFGNNNNNEETNFSEYYLKIPEFEKSPIDGVWKRVGTIEYVNNVPVDTIPVVGEEFINYKFYHNGKFMFFFRNLTIQDNTKQGFYGQGVYGNFEYKNGILTERIDYGTRGMENFFKNLPNKDRYGEPYISFETNLSENSYSQRWPGNAGGGNTTSEYYIKIN